jgi:uncharacterized membrane protein
MHPLDEQYWSKREYWRWWGYICPDDPRIIVSKRPRWAGYTLNCAHKSAIPAFTAMVLFLMAPVIVWIILAPENDALVFGSSAVAIAVTTLVCYKAANPKHWKGQETPDH